MFYASALIVQKEAGRKKWRFMFGEKQETCTELKGPLYLGILLFLYLSASLYILYFFVSCNFGFELREQCGFHITLTSYDDNHLLK